MIRLIVASMLLFNSCAYAQEWVELSRSGTSIFEGRAGSIEYTLTEQTREPIVAMIVRVRNTATGQIAFEKNYVRMSDCSAGYGKIVTTDLNGKAKYQNDFILQGGNVASSLAELLCSIASDDTRNKPANVAPSPGRRF